MADMVVREECPLGTAGKAPSERTVEELLHNGFIILDKWAGPTSREVTTKLKDLLGLNLAGHSGTLDPPATGVLPICLGNATKVISVLQGMDKEYVGVFHLHTDVPDKKLKEAMGKFLGEIKQRPPLRAAVARRVRARKVYEYELLDRKGREIAVRARVQAGTYIRMLAHDLGLALKTGCHMRELRRVQAGPFTEMKAHTMQELKAAVEAWQNNKDEGPIRRIILPVEEAVQHVKKVVIKDSAIPSVTNGSPIYASAICSSQSLIRKGDQVAVFSLKGELVALGIANMITAEMMSTTKKGAAVKTDRVIMRQK
jgi:H/ACA ribonucleoprotein complex subunit 4